MKCLSQVAAVLAVVVVVGACASEPESEPDPYAQIDVATAGKDDSSRAPTAMGALPFDLAQPATLLPFTSGYHLYRLRARAGWSVRVMASSPSFKTYVRLTAPNGRSWSDRGDVRTPDDERYHAILDVFDLPLDGEYQVLVSSVANMSLFPFATTWGDYQLSAETDIECRLSTLGECPETLTCRHERGDPAGFGTCLRR